MTYAQIDDCLPDHPKILAAGPAAAWLFIAGVCYCNRLLTDGFIPDAAAKRLVDVDDVTALVTQLITIGLWQPCDGGYHVHDFLDWNPSAEQVRQRRAKAAERQARWRNTHLDTSNKEANNGVTHPSRHVPVREPNNGVTNAALSSPLEEEEEEEEAAPAPAREAVTAAPPIIAPAETLAAFHDQLKHLKSYQPSPQFYAKVAEKYGHLDLEEEGLKIVSWLRQHEKRECSTAFLLNWLKKAADDEQAWAAERQAQAAAPVGAGPSTEPAGPVKREYAQTGPTPIPIRGSRKGYGSDVIADRLQAVRGATHEQPRHEAAGPGDVPDRSRQAAAHLLPA